MPHSELVVPEDDPRQRHLLLPALSCLESPERPCKIREITLEIVADEKLQLWEIAKVISVLGPILDQGPEVGAGSNSVSETSGQNQRTGPDADFTLHWGMAFDGGFVSSLFLRRRRRRKGARSSKP